MCSIVNHMEKVPMIKSNYFTIATALTLAYTIFWENCWAEYGYLGKFGMCWVILNLVILVWARSETKNRENELGQLKELEELRAALAKREGLLETVYEIKSALKGA